MKNIEETRYKFIIIFSAILITTFMFISYRFMIPEIGISVEDYEMRKIVSGGYNTGDWHIVFSNVLLGKLFQMLYSLGEFPWWEYIQIGLIYIAFVELNMQIIRNAKTKNALLLMFILWGLGLKLCVYVDFRYTSVFLCSVGLGLIALNNAENVKWFKCVQYIIGLAFVFIGVLYSWVASLISLVFIFPLLFKKNGRVFIEFVKNKMILKVCLPILIMAILTFVSQFCCYSQGKWKEWKDYNRIYTQIKNEGIPEWKEYSYNYEKIGLSENDVLMLKLNISDDYRVFDTATLTQISKIQTSRNFSLDIEFWKMLFDNVLYGPFVLMIVAIVIIWLISVDDRNMKYIVYMCIVYLSINIISYITYGINALDKIYFVNVCALIFYFLLDMEYGRLLDFDLINGYGLLAALILSMFICYSSLEKISYQNYTHEDKEIIETLEHNSENTYIVYSSDLFEKILDYDIYIPKNIEILNDNIKNIPTFNTKNGLKNILREMYLKDDYYFVSDNDIIAWVIYNYFNEHSKQTIDIVLVGEVNQYKIYKFCR